MGLPPFRLVALFAIVFFYLFLSSYFSYKREVRRAITGLEIVLFFLPVLLIILARHLTEEGGKFKVRIPKPDHDSIHRAGRSPFGVGLLVILLLVLISYHSSVKSSWFRPLWYTSY